jgi:hypothetical protein
VFEECSRPPNLPSKFAAWPADAGNEFRRFGRPRDFPAELPFLGEEATLRNGTVFTMTTDFGIVDLLAEVTGLGSFEEVKAKAVAVDAFGRRVLTLDLSSLIRAKRAAGREKDLRALPELESLLEAEEP